MSEEHMENRADSNDNKNIARRSFKAASWVLIVQFTTQFIQILLGICMVRLLEPSDYGIVGMLAIFWAVSIVFIRGGFGAALIQKKDINEVDLCSVFYYNIFLSFLCCGLMLGFAHKIAVFYGQEILEQTIKVSAWALPISAMVSVQNVILDRQLKQFFRKLSILISNVIAGLVAICLAWRGMGVWAIVWQQFLATLFTSISIFLFVRWIPKLKFSFKSLTSLFAFGSKLIVVELLDVFTINFGDMVIGKCYTSETLGFYSRSKYFSRLWPYSVQWAIGDVLFPAFSKIQDDLLRLRNAFRRALMLSAFAVIFPPFLLCTLCKPLIILVLGEKWLPCLPYWWLTTCAFAFFPIQILNIQLLKARGRSDLFLILEITKKFLFAIQIVVLILWGIIPMLVCEITFSLICVYLNSFFTGRDLNYGMADQLYDLLPYVGLTIPACILGWLSYLAITPFNPWLGLVLSGFIGAFAYMALNRIFKTQALSEIINLVGYRFPAIKNLLLLK